MRKIIALMAMFSPGMVFGIGSSIQTSIQSINPNSTLTVSTITASQNSTNPGAFQNAPFSGACNINGYCQGAIQNQNNGANASSDWIVTNDLGGDTSFYLNIGINSSKYSQNYFTVTPSSAGYLYTSDSPLIIGAGSNGTMNSLITPYINFFTSAPSAGNVMMQISTASVIVFSSLTVNANAFSVGGSTFVVNQGTTIISNAQISIATVTTLYVLGGIARSTVATYGGAAQATSILTTIPTFCMQGTTVSIVNVNGPLEFRVMGAWDNSTLNDSCLGTINLDGSLALGAYSPTIPMAFSAATVGAAKENFSIIYRTTATYTGSHTACFAFAALTGGTCTVESATAPLYIEMREAK